MSLLIVLLNLVIMEAVLESLWVIHGLLQGKHDVSLADIDGLPEDLVVCFVILVTTCLYDVGGLDNFRVRLEADVLVAIEREPQMVPLSCEPTLCLKNTLEVRALQALTCLYQNLELFLRLVEVQIL